MGAFKYRRNYNIFFNKKNRWDFGKYYREGSRYHDMLPSGYYRNQIWGALHKAWIGYCIAINKWEFDKEIKYARLIRKFQRDLGLELSDFKCLH
ncbi:MAG TPA: hypothetical protein VEW92_03505 [Nitrososphaeraceae archaeon]|jgi:hypothetical protein|nr:hypothetical protein [Nitrososphaeraceae archaeon]